MADAPRSRRRPRPSSSFLRFLLRRAAALVLLAVGITLVVFVLTQLVPSNAVATNLGEQAAADPAAVAAFKAHYGLDKPLPVRYWLYLKHLVQGDLGQSSLTHDAVTHDLGQFIPATAELALYSIVIAAVFGITFGVIAALRRNRPADHILRVVSLGGISMPTFWIALVALYLGFFRLGWFPGAERLDPGVLPPPHKTGLYTIDALLAGQWGLFAQALHHLVLPALVLAAFSVGLLTRYTRSAVLEVVGNDYVRAARAKGLPELGSDARAARRQGACDDGDESPPDALPADPAKAERGRAFLPAAATDAGVCVHEGPQERVLQRAVPGRRHAGVAEVVNQPFATRAAG